MAIISHEIDWTAVQTGEYLSDYGKAQEEAERQLKRCCVCGDTFSPDEGKVILIRQNLYIKHRYICDGCIASIEEIEDESF